MKLAVHNKSLVSRVLLKTTLCQNNVAPSRATSQPLFKPLICFYRQRGATVAQRGHNEMVL